MNYEYKNEILVRTYLRRIIQHFEVGWSKNLLKPAEFCIHNSHNQYC